MLKRDPRDPRRRERLAGSYLASLIVHALIAALLFTLASSSSQEGASESVSGGTLVTLEQRAPVVAQVAAPAQQAAPVPNVPRVAPVVHHAPLVRPQRQPKPPQRHELAKFAPTAPPNPTPVPQASTQPVPQPTTPVYETRPQNELPAVPTAVPSVPIQSVAMRIPPTSAPTPVPSVAPTAKPTPRPPAPTAAPTAKPATPAPSAPPTAAPTSAAVVAARATSAPTASPQPVSRPSLAPAANAGVPSPSPTEGAKENTTTGTQPSPGPKSQGSPGPRPGSGGKNPGPKRPIEVPATPKPQPASGAAGKSVGGGIHNDLGSLLSGMIPHNKVNPSEANTNFHVGLGGSMEPTPPPEVIAMTKFTFEERGAGSDALDKMWVTSTRRVGPALICEGWMVRYPPASQPGFQEGNMTHNVSGGIVIGTSIGGSAHGGLGPPIVEAHASASCTERALVPFTRPSPPSP
ncbi:MAG TPA: hypothetical protein VMV65_08510 [Alphaproteobacteria bacterium]|nr:hypothetical protein [Alphaproteobacteria bacterium]